MRILPTFIFLYVATLCYGVSISLYGILNDDCDTERNHETCKNIARSICCVRKVMYQGREEFDACGSVSFFGMAFSDVGIGGHSGGTDHGCHTYITHGRGFNLCLFYNHHDLYNGGVYEHCIEGSDEGTSGANVNCPKSDHLMGSTVLEKRHAGECVAVDRAVIGGHEFYINYRVPDAESQKLHELVDNNTKYDDVPEHLRKWEVSSEVLENEKRNENTVI